MIKHVILAVLCIAFFGCSKELSGPSNPDSQNATPKSGTGLTLYTGSSTGVVANTSDSEDETINRALVKLGLALESSLSDQGIREWIKDECQTNKTNWILIQDFFDEYPSEESDIINFLTSTDTLFGFQYSDWDDFLDSLVHEEVEYNPVIGILNDASTTSDPVISSGVEVESTSSLDDPVFSWDYDYSSPKPVYLTDLQCEALETQVFGLSIHGKESSFISEPEREIITNWNSAYDEPGYYQLTKVKIHERLEKNSKSEISIRAYYLDDVRTSPQPNLHYLKSGLLSFAHTDEIKEMAKIHKNSTNTWQNASILRSKIDGATVGPPSPIHVYAIDATFHSDVNLYYAIYERDWFQSPKTIGGHIDALNSVSFSTHGKMKYENDFYIYSDQSILTSTQFNSNAVIPKSTLHSSTTATVSNSRIDREWKYIP